MGRESGREKERVTELVKEKGRVKCTANDCLNSPLVERTEQQWQVCGRRDQCLLYGLLSVCSAYSSQTMPGGEPELLQYRDQLKASFDGFQVCKLVCGVSHAQHWISHLRTLFFSSAPPCLSLVSPWSV